MLDYKRLSELWIKVAEENDMLGEVCILKDYDPEIGKVPEHFVPGLPWFFMLHFLKAVAAEGIDFPSVAAGVQGDAARDVLAERARQIEGEGWTTEHDSQHGNGDMALAAACYALHSAGLYQVTSMAKPPEHWPWSYADWKPRDGRRDLVRSAALVIAEIERLDRAARAQSTKGA